MTVSASRTSTDINDPELQAFSDVVRMVLRDRSYNNILLDDVQFTDDDLRNAIRLATGSYNVMSPVTEIAWDAIPEPILLLWTCYWLMLSESFLQVRNQVSVPSDGLGVIGIDDKAPAYMSIANGLKAEAKQAAKDYKHSRNLEACYGSLPSGYSNVSRYNQ